MMRQAAEAFWGVLLSAPNGLADFEAKVMDLGVSVTLYFGCEDGEPYCHEILSDIAVESPANRKSE
jgi:hypothetical protein